jgi:hypothetical protein
MFQAAHRPQPGFQSAVVGFSPVVGVALGVGPESRSQFIEDAFRLLLCIGILCRRRTWTQRHR